MTRSSTHIPGVSFSWRRAIGLSSLEGKVSRATGIPMTRSGREKKMGHIFIHLIGWMLLALIVFVAYEGITHPAALRFVIGLFNQHQ